MADQFVGGPAEHRLDGAIRKDEGPAGVRGNDALCGGLEERSQRAIVFLVSTRLQGILSPATFCDVQLESSQPSHLTGDVTVGPSQTVHPSFGPVRAQDPVRVIPRIPRLQNLFERTAHPRAVFDVQAREPRLEYRRLFGRESELFSEGVIPVRVIRAEVPGPGPAGRRFERQTEPCLLFPECGVGAGPLHRVPGPLGDLPNEFNLPRRPDPGRLVTGPEGGNHASVLEQRQSHIRADLAGSERRPLIGRQPLIGLNVADNDGLASLENLAQRRPHGDSHGLPRDRHAAGVLVANDVLAAFRFREADASCAEVLGKVLCRDVLDGSVVSQWADGVVQPEEERLPAFIPPKSLFDAGPLAGAPHPLGGHFNQCDLIASPGPRCCAVDAECPKPLATLD